MQIYGIPADLVKYGPELDKARKKAYSELMELQQISIDTVGIKGLKELI